jgi:hypothetical protein
MANLKPKKPVLMFFQEIKPGDVAKQKAASNKAATGGGARDLRIRPAQEFTKILSPMFPLPGSKTGVSQGNVHWFDKTNSIQSAQVEFWRPTEARPGEARLGRIHAIDAWTVDEPAYDAAIKAGMKWFYLLVMDADGIVWARLVKEENLPNENKSVRDYIHKRINETFVSHAVRGTMNFQSKKVYP